MARSTRRRAGALALAGLLLAAGWVWAETPAERVERHKMAQRIAKVEERLAAVHVEGRKAEILTARAKAMLDLSRRFLNGNNTAAAQVHADIAERFTALAEGKGVQQ